MRISIFSSSLIFSLFVCKGINDYLIIIQKSLIKFRFLLILIYKTQNFALFLIFLFQKRNI